MGLPLLLFASGLITTLSGTGERGFSGDGGPADAAALGLAFLTNECDPGRFEEQSHLSVDPAGNIYLADSSNHRLRRISPNGLITTLAGSGERPTIDSRCSPLGGAAAIGENGPAATARLYGPAQALAAPGNALLLVDQKNNRIRQIAADGRITTLVGSNLHAFFAPNIPATSSPLDWPSAAAYAPDGSLYFAELHSHRIARLLPTGRLQLIAGTGFAGDAPENVPAAPARPHTPTPPPFDPAGNLYIADQGNHKIRRISPDGIITTLAGTGAAGFSGDGGPAAAARLNLPNALALDPVGNLYIADMGNHRIRRLSPDGIISTIAGTGQPGRGADNVPATESALRFPNSLAIHPSGDLLIADWQNFRIRRVTFAPRPALAAGGIVNGASFAAGPVAPGALVSLFGANFAPGLTQASTVPLPSQLAGVRVTAAGRPWPLVFVPPNQINVQVPYNAPPGPLAVTVSTAAGDSTATVQIVPAAPGIFLRDGRRAIAQNQDFRLNDPAAPAPRRSILTVYLTGQGPLDGPLDAGDPAPTTSLLRALAPPAATIGGRPANVLFLGLTPGFVGLAQANLEIPADSPAGAAVELTLSLNGQPANAATISIE
ncbi:MAG: hypothetical protein INH40_11695 [Acidobacteriaceae bacterium]|nr:hypothetical protein [Acidobacteriaceae bacterium]